jgi:hypothetical protein
MSDMNSQQAPMPEDTEGHHAQFSTTDQDDTEGHHAQFSTTDQDGTEGPKVPF